VAKYYDLAVANERLTDLRPLLAGLRDDRDTIVRSKVAVDGPGVAWQPGMVEQPGMVVDPATLARMEAAVRQIDAWGIMLRDIGTGLVDLPALVNGRPIWLCWKLGEDDIAWWHELESGLAGRRPLIELE